MPELRYEEKGDEIYWHILDFMKRTPVAWCFSYYALLCRHF